MHGVTVGKDGKGKELNCDCGETPLSGQQYWLGTMKKGLFMYDSGNVMVRTAFLCYS